MLRRLIAFLAALAVALPAHALTPGQRAAVLSNPCAGIVLGVTFAGQGPAACSNGSPKSSPTAIPGWSFSRTGQGDAQWADGHLQLFGTGVLRQTDQGALIEQAATNLVKWSNDETNVAWTALLGSVAGTALGPDGTSTAQTYTATSSSGRHGTQQSGTITTGAVVTSCIYSAYVNNAWVQVGVFDTAWHMAAFNVQTGVAGAVDAGVTSTVTPASQGFYRLCSTFTTSGTTTPFFGFGLAPSNTTTTGWAATGVEAAKVFGAQLETGSFATSYIPTTSAAATRGADVASITSASTNECLNTFVEAVQPPATFSGQAMRFFDNQSNGAGLVNFANNLTTIQGAGGLPSITITTAPIVKVAYTITAAGQSIAANGGASSTQAGAQSCGPTLATVVGNRSAGDRAINGYVRYLKLLKGTRTNLQALSTLP